MQISISLGRQKTGIRAMAKYLVCRAHFMGRAGYNLAKYLESDNVLGFLCVGGALMMLISNWWIIRFNPHMALGIAALGGCIAGGTALIYHYMDIASLRIDWLLAMASQAKGRELGWIFKKANAWDEATLLEAVKSIPVGVLKQADRSILAGILVHPIKEIREAGVLQMGTNLNRTK